MTVFGMLAVGIVLLIIAHNVAMAAPLNTLARVLGWCLIAVAVLLLTFGLLGLSTGALSLR